MKFERISDIGKVVSGSTPKTDVAKYWNGDIHWVTPKEISQLRSVYLNDTERKLTIDGFNSCSTTIIPRGNILFTSRAPIGLIAINNIDVCTNQGFKSIILNEGISSLYVYYFLKANIRQINNLGTGTTFKEISKTTFEKIKIPLPSLEIQTYIANTLFRVESLIAQRKESIRLLDEFLKSTFLEMFGDPVRNEKGWKKVKLRDLCKIRRGASPRPISNFTGGNVPWIKIGDGTNGNELYIESTSEYITEDGAAKSVILNEGSLIFANCGVSLGFARILKIKGCIHDGWLSFEELNSELDTVFLLKLINHSTNYLRSLAPGGTQPNLNTSIMGRFGIILPPINQQNNFSQTVKKTEILRIKYLKSLHELENLYSSLSQKAFKGEMGKM